MTPVKRPEFADPEWTAWSGEARAAIETLRKDYRPGVEIRLRADLYAQAKPFLLKLFNDKCAYCESLISNTQPGDVEHYRPKGRIRDLDGRVVRIVLAGKEVDHPGYWWLCYEWLNLLPSCIDCNRRRRHEQEDQLAGKVQELAGKAELFPIAGRRAAGPDDPLSAEEALLLNPTEDDFNPEEHFELLPDGKIAPKTTKAKTTCEILGLNLREKLVEQRANAYDAAVDTFSRFISVSMASLEQPAPGDQEKRLRQRINDMWEGRTQYTAFARLALSVAKRTLSARNININFPLPPL